MGGTQSADPLVKDIWDNELPLNSLILNQFLQYNDVNKCVFEKCGCETNEDTVRSSWRWNEQIIICDFWVYNPDDWYDTIDDVLDYIWSPGGILALETSPVMIVTDGDKWNIPKNGGSRLTSTELKSRKCSGEDFDSYIASGFNFTRRVIDIGYVTPLCLSEKIGKVASLSYSTNSYSTDIGKYVYDFQNIASLANHFTCRNLCEASVPVGLEAALDAAGVHKVTSGTCNPITYDECKSLRTLFANTLELTPTAFNGYPQGCFINSNNYLFYNEPDNPLDCSDDNPCLCGECPPGQYIQGGTCVDCDTCHNKFIKHGTCSRNRDSVCLDCPTDVSWTSTPQTGWAPAAIPYYRMSNFNDENSCRYSCPGGTKMSLYGPLQEANGYMEGPMRCLPECTPGAIDCADGSDPASNYCAFYLDGTCVSECPLIDNGKCVQKTKQWLEDEYKLVAQC